MTIRPRIIASPSAWRGPEIDYRMEGLHVFSEDEIDEIDAGLFYLKSLGEFDFDQIGPEQFPLRRASDLLRDLRDKLRRGRGFMLLRGLPRERYSADDMARIYLGLGTYLGRPMVQSYQGELLGHVVDVSDIEQQPRAYHRGGKQEMHTDSCDVIGLMCLRTALNGGASRISSSVAVHNEIVGTRPDLAEILYRGFHYRRTELDAKYGSGVVTSPHRITVFARTGDEVSCHFLASYAYRAAERGDVELNELEREAIGLMQKLADSPEFYLDMEFADGDIQFLNNRVIFHGRTDYDDSPDFERRRHLLRLWLAMPSWPPLPSSQVFHTAEDQRLWLKQRTHLMEMPSTYKQRLNDQYHGLGLAKAG
jgi:hypothetical protein